MGAQPERRISASLVILSIIVQMATAQKNQEASGLIASILSKPQLKIKVLPMKG